ncbi:MAG: biotin-dependent carboxyltransferase family protein, partial [Muriicola sp.]|nr:biotin-dependent carboxyltransferase family protein [Muriicola sp.]
GQTTGGYPRVLQLSEESINHLAQRTYGDTVHFKLET